MARTLQQLIESAARHLGHDPADVVSDAILRDEFTGYVRMALRDLARARPWRWLYASATLATANGQNYVALPDDFESLWPRSRPYYSDGAWRLEAADLAVIDSLRACGSVTTQRATLYALIYDAGTRLNRLTLHPTPDAIYSILIAYRRTLAVPAALTTAVSAPDEMDDLLEYGVQAVAEEQVRKVARGERRDAFERGIGEQWAQTHAAQVDQEPVRLRRVNGGMVDEERVRHANSVTIVP